MIVHKSDLLGFAIGLSVKVNEGQVRLLNRYSMNTGCMFNRFSMFSKTNGHTTHDLEHCIIQWPVSYTHLTLPTNREV